jgi:hypothetical protein
VQLANEKTWDGEHLTVESCATVYHAPTGIRLGYGEGMCSTREKKYGKRKQERECPQCGVAAIIKGKAEYGGGWVCFKKKNGCGAKFPTATRPSRIRQVGEIENPDLPDSWNTVVKMAEKRARVDAVLAVTGASALFTQDVEDERRAGRPRQVARPLAEGADGRTAHGAPRRARADRREPVVVVDALTVEQAAAVADALERRPVPTGESDVPGAAPGEFQHPPAQPTLEEAGSTA